MSPNNIRLSLLVACLLVLALFAVPTSTATGADDAFDVAARAEMGANGREMQVASGAKLIPVGRVAEPAGKMLASGAKLIPVGRVAEPAGKMLASGAKLVPVGRALQADGSFRIATGAKLVPVGRVGQLDNGLPT